MGSFFEPVCAVAQQTTTCDTTPPTASPSSAERFLELRASVGGGCGGGGQGGCAGGCEPNAGAVPRVGHCDAGRAGCVRSGRDDGRVGELACRQ